MNADYNYDGEYLYMSEVIDGIINKHDEFYTTTEVLFNPNDRFFNFQYHLYYDYLDDDLIQQI